MYMAISITIWPRSPTRAPRRMRRARTSSRTSQASRRRAARRASRRSTSGTSLTNGAPGLEAERSALRGREGRERAVFAARAPRPRTGSAPEPGDHVVEKMRMNGFYETRLDILLRGLGVETLIISGRVDEHVDRAHCAPCG